MSQLDNIKVLAENYKRLGKKAEAEELYKKAMNMCKEDKERLYPIMLQYMMLHIYFRDVEGMQSLATLFCQTFGEIKFHFWAVACYIILARKAKEANIEDGKNSSLKYAEAFVDNAMEKNFIQSSEALLLYLDTMELCGRYDDALKAVNHIDFALTLEKGLQYIIKVPAERRRLEFKYLARLGQWQKLFDRAQCSAIVDKDDDWMTYEHLIYSALQLNKLLDADLMMSAALYSCKNEKVVSKNPTLARMNLWTRAYLDEEARQGKEANAYKQRMIDAYCEHFIAFGTKSVCFEDMEMSLVLIPSMEIREAILKSLPQPPNANTIENIQRDVCLSKLRMLIDREGFSDKMLTQLVTKLMQQYFNALPFGKNLVNTDMQYGDEYLMMACHLLIEKFAARHVPLYLVMALVLLEQGIKKSDNHFQMKLLAISLYTHLGVFRRALELFESLDVKNIQWDTLGYLLHDHVIDFGYVDKALKMFSEAESLYENNSVETPDMVLYAMRCSTYSKIEEFLEFYEKLDRSISRAVLEGERLRATLWLAMPDSGLVKKALKAHQFVFPHGNTLSSLHNNRDEAVYLFYSKQTKRSWKNHVRKPIYDDFMNRCAESRYLFSLLMCVMDNQTAEMRKLYEEFETFYQSQEKPSIRSQLLYTLFATALQLETSVDQFNEVLRGLKKDMDELASSMRLPVHAIFFRNIVSIQETMMYAEIFVSLNKSLNKSGPLMDNLGTILKEFMIDWMKSLTEWQASKSGPAQVEDYFKGKFVCNDDEQNIYNLLNNANLKTGRDIVKSSIIQTSGHFYKTMCAEAGKRLGGQKGFMKYCV